MTDIETITPPQPNQAIAEAKRYNLIDIIQALPESPRRDEFIQPLIENEARARSLDNFNRVAKACAISNEFGHLKGKSLEQAMATVLAQLIIGEQMGMTVAESLTSVYFVNGKPSVMNDFVSEKLADMGYGWQIEWVEDPKNGRCTGCKLWVLKNGKPLLDKDGHPVHVKFLEEDAKTAGLLAKDPWVKYGRDMYFWKCIARLQKYYAPGALKAGVKMAAEVMEADFAALPVEEPEPAPPPARRRDLRAELGMEPKEKETSNE